MASNSNQSALMAGIISPNFKNNRSSKRRLLSRKKYLQRQTANLHKSSPKIESLKNAISEPPNEAIYEIVICQNEISTYNSCTPLVIEDLPNYDENENILFHESWFLMFTTLSIFCLYYFIYV